VSERNLCINSKTQEKERREIPIQRKREKNKALERQGSAVLGGNPGARGVMSTILFLGVEKGGKTLDFQKKKEGCWDFLRLFSKGL